MKNYALVLMLLVVGIVTGLVLSADQAYARDSWGFHYGSGGRHYDYRHRPYGGYHYCPPRYDYHYHYQPYYGYGWRGYQPPCPPRHEYRRGGYYGFYYESR